MTVRELIRQLSAVSDEQGPDTPVYFDTGRDYEPNYRISTVGINGTPQLRKLDSEGVRIADDVIVMVGP